MRPRNGKIAAFAVAAWIPVTLLLRYETASSWGLSALLGALTTPLILWLTWLRRRMNEQAREWGRRSSREWPENKR